MAHEDVVKNVTEGGYCIGCGGCAIHSDSIEMKLNKYGQMIPVVDATKPISQEENKKIAYTCGFSGQGEDEDAIGNRLYARLPKHQEIGHYDNIHAGRVKDNAFYTNGSSGGIGKWLLAKLIENGHVDYVIQVSETVPDDGAQVHYAYQVFDAHNQIIEGSKSAYYPIEMSQVLEFIRSNNGRYVITGVPCFIKTIRRLQQVEAVFAERITFTLSIVCGHLKTKSYAEMIGWQLGVEPEQLNALDFRKKISGKKANQKGVQAIDKNGVYSRDDIVQNLFGTNYGHGLFKYSACDYCDDVVGETADVSVGDAWLKEYMEQGTSLVIVRNSVIQGLMDEYQHELSTTLLTGQQAADSQRAGLRHRRDYLQYRLWLKQKTGQWFPKKRVPASESHLSSQAKKIVKTRIKLAEISHEEFEVAKKNMDFTQFKKSLMPYMEHLHDLTRRPAIYAVVRTLRFLKLYNSLASLQKYLKR